ncbi:MAG: ATP-dependent DNA ligase [Dermatophilaceae bacterium]
MTAFAVLVEAAAAVGAVPGRNAKVARLAATLGALDADEVEPAVGMLTARLRQGRLGIGWATVSELGVPPAAEPVLTVGEVDDALSELTAVAGKGSALARRETVRRLWAKATAQEQDWLIRLMLGDVRIGALDGLMVEAVANGAGMPVASVRRAVMLSGSLGRTAYLALTGTLADVDAVGLSVGTPVLPMLASTAPDVAAALAQTGRASVEFKLDGARVQVHREGGPTGPVRVFTRTLAEITDRVPEVVEMVRDLPGASLILDGETLSLDEDGRPRPFQETMSRFGASAAREELLRPWFFDVLHADGVDLLDEPLARRRAVLHTVVGPYAMPGVETDDPRVAEALANAALDAGHEGVVVKALDAPYAAGRRGKSWLKVKPVHTYDLVVLAAEWGSGRRTGWLSNLHLGARDPGVPLGEPGAFVMVGKTFKGLTDEVLRWQTEHFPTIETGRTRHVVHVEPVTVVEVAIDGVQRSTRYPGGVALRFARVKRYRADKLPQDADTIATLRALLA